MKVFRSTLLAAAAVLAAACGDKITPPAKGVLSVAVAPSSATIAKGTSIQLTAAVSADPGVAITPVAWTSSDATKASVDQTGKVSGVVATPGVAICAAIGGKTGCASIIVTEAQVTVPQITIRGIFQGSINTPAPTPPATVAGPVIVAVDLVTNAVSLSRVEVLIDDKVAGTIGLTAAQNAELNSASGVVAEQGVGSTLNIVVNTADYDPTTFVAKYLNGSHKFSARAIGTGTGVYKSTSSQSYTFLNADTFNSAVTITPSTVGAVVKQVPNAFGFQYTRGNLSVVVNPILYTPGRTIVTGPGTVVSFGSTACNTAGGPAAPITAALTGTGPFTATLLLDKYEFNAANVGCTLNAVGETVTLTAVDNLGNQFITGALPANLPAPSFRIDNRGPAAPILNASTAAIPRPTPVGSMPKGRTSFWLNDAVTFNGLATSTATAPTGGVASNGLICDNQTGLAVGNCPALTPAPIDLGVGGQNYAVAAVAGDVAATAAAAAPLTNAATLAPSVTNGAPLPGPAGQGYCGVAFAIDALGNQSAANPTGSTATSCSGQSNGTATGLNPNVLTFGVDRAPPTISFTNAAGTLGSTNALTRINTATLGGEFVVTAADTGAVGNSGLAPVAAGPTAGPVLMLLAKRVGTNVSTNLTANPVGFPSNPTAPVSTGVLNTPPTYSTTISGQSTAGVLAAYWTLTALAQDAAGNQSGVISRVVAGDNNAATASAPSVGAISGPFSAASFLNDNLSIRDYYYTLRWNGGPGTFTVAAAPTVVDAFNSATLSNTNVPLSTSINTVLALQDGSTVPPTVYNPLTAPLLDTLNLFVRDQTQTVPAYTKASSPLAVAAPPASAGIVIGTTFTGGYTPTTSAATACAAAAASAGCTVSPATPATVTWAVNSTGTTGTFNNPFARVDFYANTGTGDFTLIGSVPAASATLVDNGVSRVWTYTLSPQSANALFLQFGGVAGGAPGAAVALNVRAFGVSSTGPVALVSANLTQNINP